MCIQGPVEFDPIKTLEKLENLGVKRSYLSNPNSIYYVGCSSPVITKAFKTGTIRFDVLCRIELLIGYLSDPSLKRPSISNLLDLQAQNDILQNKIDAIRNENEQEVKRLKEIIEKMALDLRTYSSEFQRASDFLNYSIK